MLKRLTSISFSCFLIAIFSLQGEAKVTSKITDLDLSNDLNQKLQNTGAFLASNRQILINFPIKLANSFSSDRDLNKSEQKNLQAQLTAAAKGNYMMLTPTGKANARGNPLYDLKLYANGQLINTYKTVSGRAFTQGRNRHRAGTEAPLPDGRYEVAKASIPGTIVEAGDRFLPIQPLFQTGRSALGIHYDPSYEKKNGEDGTSGCIALTNRDKLTEVLNYVRTYQPKYLEVYIR